MFLKGDIPTGPVKGADKWRKVHRKKREDLHMMEKLFIEAGTRKEAEELNHYRKQIDFHVKGDGFVVPRTPDSSTPLPGSGIDSEAGGGRCGQQRNPDPRSPPKEAAEKEKFSGANSARNLTTLLRQIYRGIEKSVRLRTIDDVEEIYEELVNRHTRLIKSMGKLQFELASIITEGYHKHMEDTKGKETKMTPNKCLRILARLSENRDSLQGVGSKSIVGSGRARNLANSSLAGRGTSGSSSDSKKISPLAAFFKRCLTRLSTTEKGILWLLLRRSHIFESDLEPGDPRIVTSMLVRLLYQPAINLRLPPIASVVTQTHVREMEIEKIKRREMRKKNQFQNALFEYSTRTSSQPGTTEVWRSGREGGGGEKRNSIMATALAMQLRIDPNEIEDWTDTKGRGAKKAPIKPSNPNDSFGKWAEMVGNGGDMSKSFSPISHDRKSRRATSSSNKATSKSVSLPIIKRRKGFKLKGKTRGKKRITRRSPKSKLILKDALHGPLSKSMHRTTTRRAKSVH